jgi:hypothetical protein
MKKLSIIACGLGLAFLVASVFAADKKQPTLAEANATIQELAKQIDTLKSNMKDMEQRLTKLEKAPKAQIVTLAPFSGAPGVTMPPIVVPRAMRQPDAIENNFADPNNPPKIWGEGECNGWKFYTIPISATERGAAEAIPLSGR